MPLDVLVAVVGPGWACDRQQWDALICRVREILSETTVRHAKQAIIDVAKCVELSAYETPAFHDRLVRAAAGSAAQDHPQAVAHRGRLHHRPAGLGAGMAGLLALAMSGRLELAETATAAGALLILGERI
jgi:hypothetical protein